MNVLEVDDVSKNYGETTALDKISFQIQKGEIFGFLGRNGAGKTTTIKVLTTLIRPDAGHAIVFGYDVTKEPLEVRKHIGLVQQKPCNEFSLVLERQLDVYGRLWGLGKEERKSKIEFLINKFGLRESLGKTPYQMSIGQRRRLQIAREMMHETDLLFLDEPTTSLDVQTRRSTLDFFKEKVSAGLTVFLTTHILEEAEYLCDRVAIIDKGRVLVVDSVGSLKRKVGMNETVELAVDAPGNAVAIIGGLSGIEDVTPPPSGGSVVKVRFRSDQAGHVISDVVSSLAKEGINIAGLNVSQPTLEDIFIELTR